MNTLSILFIIIKIIIIKSVSQIIRLNQQSILKLPNQ